MIQDVGFTLIILDHSRTLKKIKGGIHGQGRYSKTGEQLMDLKKQNAKVESIGMNLEKTDGNQFGLLES